MLISIIIKTVTINLIYDITILASV